MSLNENKIPSYISVFFSVQSINSFLIKQIVHINMHEKLKPTVITETYPGLHIDVSRFTDLFDCG